MLRQLPKSLVAWDHDSEFLQQNCSVNDESGKILDLYIAMTEDTISWAELKECPPYTSGLEDAWTYDKLLDGPDQILDKLDASRPAAGDIITTWSPTLKRNASEISRAPSFGSSSDAEGTRSKIRRQCTATGVERVGRRAEAV